MAIIERGHRCVVGLDDPVGPTETLVEVPGPALEVLDLLRHGPQDLAEADHADRPADAEQALIDAFLRYILLFMAVVSTGFAVSSVLRLRSEEESGRADAVLATGVSRTRWAAAAVVVAGLGSLVLLVVMGAGLAVGYGLGTGEWDQLASHVAGQLAYLPGVYVVAAFAVAVLGLSPRLAMLAWFLVAAVSFQTMLGQTLRLPDAVDAISPFWHLSGVPQESFDPVPALAELLSAAALVAFGLWGYRRRDLSAT